MRITPLNLSYTVCSTAVCSRLLRKSWLPLLRDKPRFWRDFADRPTRLVLPAGLLYKYKKTRTTALIGSIAGAVIMGAFSIVSNYFLVYPVYYNFMPQEAVLGAYQLIAPSMKSILQCLICFNMPFTFIKGMFSVVITFVTYKHISPILKGRQS